MVTSYRRRALDGAIIASVTEIYERSFPIWQRMPTERLFLSIGAGQRTLWLHGSHSAFGVTLSLQTDKTTTVLEYLAVHPEQRSNGLGGELLDQIIREVNEPIVFEVEDPEREGTVQSIKRITFYERHGCRLVECATGYAMPSLDDETGETLMPMLLYEVGTSRASTLRGDTLRRVVEGIWVESYGLPSGDPRLILVLDRFQC
jgi:hypothetical protein